MKYSDKTILITGGTGSFGKKVATYLASKNPKKIVIFSRDEKKQHDMQLEFPDFRFIIGDVRDFDRMMYAMQGVNFVFHAAAMKQVPSCEANPFEAVRTNVLGSQNVCNSAIQSDVSMVVALSTDKAVKPINAMGMTKAIMEKIVTAQNMNDCPTNFCCVRYGNVMGSRGSVIPLFYKQIKQGERLTITEPTMTRFLMTLDQSVELVQHAMETSRGGEVFVKKAPACTVFDLAKTMLVKYGDGDLDRIVSFGPRPGEKTHEVLLNEYEVTRALEFDEFFHIPAERSGDIVRSDVVGLNDEYTSQNTIRLQEYEDISSLLDMTGVEQ